MLKGWEVARLEKEDRATWARSHNYDFTWSTVCRSDLPGSIARRERS
jgi:hypothetical protein